MHLSLSIPTSPSSGNVSEFVAIRHHNLSPGLRHLFKKFHNFWNPYTNCREFAMSLGVGNLSLQIPPVPDLGLGGRDNYWCIKVKCKPVGIVTQYVM